MYATKLVFYAMDEERAAILSQRCRNVEGEAKIYVDDAGRAVTNLAIIYRT